MKLFLSRFINDPTHEYVSIINDHKQLPVEHSHDYYEFFVVNHGSAIHRANGASQSLSRGTAVLMRPDDVHCYQHMSADFEIINMLVPERTMRAAFDYLGDGFEPERLVDSELPMVSCLSAGDFEVLMVQLEQLVLAKHALRGRSDAVFRFALLNVLFTCFPPLTLNTLPDMPLWLRGLCLEMMKKRNFTEGLPALQRIASKSKEHLARSFRRYLNKSPTEFVNDLRLEYCARRIISTKTKIVDICGDIGFESVSHFYHLFHKRYGLAPNEFRRKATDRDLNDALVGDPILESGIPEGISFLGQDESS